MTVYIEWGSECNWEKHIWKMYIYLCTYFCNDNISSIKYRERGLKSAWNDVQLNQVSCRSYVTLHAWASTILKSKKSFYKPLFCSLFSTIISKQIGKNQLILPWESNEEGLLNLEFDGNSES